MRWGDRDRREEHDMAARAVTGGMWLRVVTDRDVPVVAGVTLGVLAVGEAAARAAVDGAEAREWLVVCLLALATTLPLALLGSGGAAAGAVTAASTLSLGFFDTLTVAGVASQLFALYRLGGDTRATTLSTVALAAPFPVLALVLIGGDDTGAWVLTILLASLAPAAALAGLMVRARREATVHRAAREAVATSLRENTTRAERARISRELHDVVAHHVSMVAVQAETARLTTPGLPEVGAQRLADIGDTARAALTEMRRLLGVLREDGDSVPAALEPQPDLRQLGELLDRARETSGAAARLILRGPPVTLDPGVELAAYRIVQEALSNARRHAPGAAVDVELHYCDDSLHLRIRDNGPGPPPAPRDGGHGLVGMRERAVAVGGELHTGAAPGGGFLVTANLPGGKGRAPVTTPGPAASVVVADDHETVRAGFAALLATQPDLTVVGTASDGAEAVRLGRELRPDVVLMDVRMPNMDGIEATRRLTGPDGDRERGPRILILTTFDLDEYVYDALRAGASGFLLKDVTAERLFDAVRVVAAGDALLAPAVTRRLISEFAALQPEPDARSARALDRLTPRERDVLRLVAEGLSNREVAARLVVAEETVKTHVSRTLTKLGLRDRTQAVVVAYESGLVVPGSHHLGH